MFFIFKHQASIFLIIIFTFLQGYLQSDQNFYRRPDELKEALVCRTEAPAQIKDDALVKRIVGAYQLANKRHLGNSMWQLFFDVRLKSIHNILEGSDLKIVASLLRNPGSNELFYGIDALTSSLLPSLIQEPITYAYVCFDQLIHFGEAIGAIPIDYPESYYYCTPRKFEIFSLMNQIETELKTVLHFPNPYPDEFGVWTPRGVVSYRATQSLYQAWLIKKLVKNIENPRILEIGAGLGRTAYFAKLLGIEDYTIIDIPMTAVASSYFLGRTLGDDQILLLGEKANDANKRIKILTPDQFFEQNENYDLIINVDSLTEMDKKTAQKYINHIQMSTPIFISINHEINPFTVKQLIDQLTNVEDVQRHTYWMREGYVEEIVRFNSL